MLEIGLAGMPRTGREGALVITDLDQVTERIVRLVSVGLMTVVAVEYRDGPELDDEGSAVGQGEDPAAVASGRSRAVGTWPSSLTGGGEGDSLANDQERAMCRGP